MNAAYTSPDSFFTRTENEENSTGSQDMDAANKILQAAIQDPVFDSMTDEQVTGYMIAGFITAFVALFIVTYAVTFGIGFLAAALGLPLFAQFILMMIPSVLSVIYVTKVVRYLITPVVTKSMVFYAKVVTKIKSYFNKK